MDGWWNLELDCKPDFEVAMQRVYAWYEGEIIDRPPVRFMAHNAFIEEANKDYPSDQIRDRWFDVEFQVDTFLASIEGKSFHAETFPIFWPNLGPAVYAAFYGCPLEFGDVTSWSTPIVDDWEDLKKINLDKTNQYFTKIEELTCCALNKCGGRFMVGYTDLHPGLDCAAAIRGTERLCLDLYDSPAQAKSLIDIAIADFQEIFDHFDAILKARGQLSASWMGIPSFGKMHIPSCDFSALISNEFFVEFCLPVLENEVKSMTHNIFHVDGIGVANHLDAILNVPQVHAIQWVQGVGDDLPILQWIPLIKKIQAKKPVIVDLQLHELEPFITHVSPEGIFLWVATRTEEEELAVMKRLEKWT